MAALSAFSFRNLEITLYQSVEVIFRTVDALLTVIYSVYMINIREVKDKMQMVQVDKKSTSSFP